MLHDKVFCHYYFGKYLLYSANHAFMKLTVNKELKNPVKGKIWRYHHRIIHGKYIRVISTALDVQLWISIIQ